MDDRDQSNAGLSAENKLLLVDDNAENLKVLRECVEVLGCKILVAKNGPSAISIVAKAKPDIILLDIMMPEMDGYEVCRRLKEDSSSKHIPVIFLTALSDVEDEARGLSLGAVDYITKPIHPDLVRARVRNHLELKRYRDRLESMVKARTLQLTLTQAVMIESLGTLAEYRDPETGGHIKRTQNYVKALAQKLRNHPRFSAHLNDSNIEWLYLSAPLHDIGKVGVRDEILLKQGRLTESEFEQMKQHTRFGDETLRITEQKLDQTKCLSFAREIARTHHEKWDGSGYPSGLKGDDIPLAGRLMALADVYDALISKRVYKEPMSHEKAVDIIKEGKGTHFDPDVVDAFLELESVFRNIAMTFADYEEERQMLSQTPLEGDPGKNTKVNRILLAEDNEINQEIVVSQLKSAGFDVDAASDGKEALDKFRSGQYDLVLTDIEMPEMNGYELTREIRNIEKNTQKNTPILALTGNDFALSVAAAREIGFSGLMLKPLDVDLLRQKIADLSSSVQ